MTSEVLVAIVLAAAACAVAWLIHLMQSDLRVPRRGRPRRKPGHRAASEQLQQIVALERLIANATSLSSDAYGRLRPRLRATACELLAARRGIHPDPATADLTVLTGAQGTPLLGPLIRPLPHGVERGPTLIEIAATIAVLEAI
jgi:hypothetical protein